MRIGERGGQGACEAGYKAYGTDKHNLYYLRAEEQDRASNEEAADKAALGSTGKARGIDASHCTDVDTAAVAVPGSEQRGLFRLVALDGELPSCRAPFVLVF